MKDKVLITILFLLFFLILWHFWLPGPRVATDFPFNSLSFLKTLADIPRSWMERYSEGLGEYTVFSLWSYPVSLVSGILAKLSLDFSFQERLMIIAIFVLGTLSMRSFLNDLKIGSWAKFICPFFYLTTTYLILLIDGGQISIALSYSLFPAAYLKAKNSVSQNLSQKVQAALIICLIGFFDFRFLYILGLLLLIRFFYERSNIFNWLKTYLLILILVLGVNFYWILLYLKFPLSQTAYNMFTNPSSGSFITTGHAILTLSPHWYKNIFGKITPLLLEFILIPILAFLAPILKPKNREVGFWLLVALFGIFLTKGNSEPLSFVYNFLFSHLPGFSLFRDSSKFFFLICLSYTALIGFSIDAILSKVKKISVLKLVFPLGIILYLLFLLRPLFLNQMTGMFANPFDQTDFEKLTQLFSGDSTFSRIFYLPSYPPMGFSSPNHPALEASRLVNKRPFQIGIKGTYERFNFLREAPYTGELFDVAGVGYIIYPYLDPVRDNVKSGAHYYYLFLKQILRNQWIDGLVNQSPIPLIKVKNYQGRFFLTKQAWWVVGSDDIYQESTKSTALRLANNALIFSDEEPQLVRKIYQIPNLKIILNKKTKLDLELSLANPDELIFPAKDLSSQPDQSGWWKREKSDLVEWRDFLQTKHKIDNQDFDLNGGWAVSEGDLKTKIQSQKISAGNTLFARVLESSQGGQLRFYQNDQLIGSINTKAPDNNVRWFQVGLTLSSGAVGVESFGGINVINSLINLNKGEIDKIQEVSDSLKSQISEFGDQGQIDHPTLTYQQVDPTKYKVHISGLKEPKMLVFSQNYDPNWRLGDQSSIPIYSFLNGFWVAKDGDYIIEFEPQKYIYPGLAVSGITILFMLGVLARKRSRE